MNDKLGQCTFKKYFFRIKVLIIKEEINHVLVKRKILTSLFIKAAKITPAISPMRTRKTIIAY